MTKRVRFSVFSSERILLEMPPNRSSSRKTGTDSHAPNRTIREFAEKWQRPVALFALFITVLIFLIQHYQTLDTIQKNAGRIQQDVTNVSQRVDKTNEEVSGVRSRVDQIVGQLEVLRPFMESIVQSQMKKSSGLPIREFERNLPSLRATLSQARLLEVKSPPELLSSLSTKLEAARVSAPNYWPAAAELISYRSENSSSKFASAMSSENLPICTTTILHPGPVISVPSPTKIIFELPFYEHCKVMLDDPAQDAEINRQVEARAAAGIALKNALVQYRGGEISIRLLQDAHDANRKISSLVFVNCVFDLAAPENPSPPSEEVLRTLLRSRSGDILVTPGTHLIRVPPSPPLQ